MLVKICGIQTVEAACTAIEAGADFIGFVFAPSKRRISAFKAAEIAHALPSPIKKVGVFVNERAETIRAIAETVELDFIQLHGDETADFAAALPYRIIKAYTIDQAMCENISDFPCDYYLIDSPAQKYRGGSGEAFAWEKITKLSVDPNKLLLAGGLTTENVRQAITVAQPVGVDVSSGVETNGIKDNLKIKTFIQKAKT
ncbi:phosphoribosylanthranilate isomerase [Virgibacillus sp. W0430]|uniref:phosphoribosylanthranilate isomerase n=1 Tax=Virgibacillus sp. W0430 TaxID=3391580 RepID=UPI003F4465D4